MNPHLKRLLMFFGLLALGAIIGHTQAMGLNGHGPEAGFAGIFLFVIIYPALALIFALAAGLAAAWRHSNYLVATSGFFIGMIVGGLVL